MPEVYFRAHAQRSTEPVTGDVLINGVNTRSSTVATLARTVGLVFQNPSDQLFKSRVIDEVMFGPLNLAYPPMKPSAKLATR